MPDNFAGSHPITQYLINAGHRRIGFLRGSSRYWTLEERKGDYLLAMQQAGLGPDPELIPPRISHGHENGFGETLALPEPPTATFAVSDQTAIGAYRAIDSCGLQVGTDISVVGFDDIESVKVLTPSLTTVRNSGVDLGRVAFERLHGLIRNGAEPGGAPIKRSIATRIIERQSVRTRPLPSQDVLGWAGLRAGVGGEWGPQLARHRSARSIMANAPSAYRSNRLPWAGMNGPIARQPIVIVTTISTEQHGKPPPLDGRRTA